MTTIIATIVGFGFLIFIHELGHFMFAKLFKIRVDRFSIGYPPRLFGKKIGETDYCLSAIPFGGYVKIAGMVDESLDKDALHEEPKPWEFRSKPWIQRAAVLTAGSFMNLLFAFIVFCITVFVYDVYETPGTAVSEVVSGSPAESAGLVAGDRIVAIDGVEIQTWEEMTKIIRNAPEQPLEIAWTRGDSLFQERIIPEREKIPDLGIEIGRIGVAPVLVRRQNRLAHAFRGGGKFFSEISNLIFVSLKKLVLREESIRSLRGPVAIAQMAGESARSGIGSFVWLVALLSLNLGILNLLPIPVLDGGHLVFLTVEGIIRRPIPLKVKMAIQQIGMLLLFALMIFVIYNDVLRIFQK